MATLLLQAVGTFAGSFFGPIGAAIGSAVGSAAGYAIDQAIFAPSKTIEGARLAGQRPMSADEGNPVVRAYGYARVPGTVIWATAFEEERNTERSGGKGGPKTTTVTYAYYGNVAVGISEGPVAAIKRIWADGRELDLRDIDVRLYHGDEEQLPDPMIEAKQGSGNAPAYRGLAYAVFEHLALEPFGNRIPQFQFEVVRPVGTVERDVRSVCLIPGATEHGYDPQPVTAKRGDGATIEVNRHVLHADSDFIASLDELQAVCPNLKHVSLVVAWYGDDLRAGHCTIRPSIVEPVVPGESKPWRVSGETRSSSAITAVSRIEGAPAYGGTPNDASVIAAIRELKSRGISVTLNPFVLMDVPHGNGLPDPWGGAEQAAYPWRGRITCFPGPGDAASADKTQGAREQVEAFLGVTVAADLMIAGETVQPGSGADFGFRRFVLHCATLAAIAGGVDAFLIGSELRGLTTLRDGAGAFPFVEGLQALAADVHAVAGAATKITYGADWSEYFGHHPQDGSGDVLFHLDPLWADPNIDAIGIDNYMPVSDWRDSDMTAADGNPDGAVHASDVAALTRATASGEGFDWYYASRADRDARVRTPITDGAHGKPWVFRFKDLAAWWSNPHYNRIGGVEQAVPTDWVPFSKPVWFTELGCPAIDKGATRPNVFYDPKSSESDLPWHSTGARDDDQQRAYLTAQYAAWKEPSAQNPVSPITGEPMVDFDRMYLWAWDARPLPAFPSNQTQWGDADNWLRGHWLNGRLGTASATDLARTLMVESGQGEVVSAAPTGNAQGAIFTRPDSGRAQLEAVLPIFGLSVREDTTAAQEGGFTLLSTEMTRPTIIPAGEIVSRFPDPDLSDRRSEVRELPSQVVMNFADQLADYRSLTSYSRRIAVGGANTEALNPPLYLDGSEARNLAERHLARRWAARREITVRLPLRHAGLETGDVIAFDNDPLATFLVERIVLGEVLEVTARSVSPYGANRLPPRLPGYRPSQKDEGLFGGVPTVHFLDLPVIRDEPEIAQFKIAARAVPVSPLLAFASPVADDFTARTQTDGRSGIGAMLSPLAPGVAGRMDRSQDVLVRLASGRFESRATVAMLNGANALAIMATNGVWELIQFNHAEEVAAGEWRLSGLLRGQAGTEDAMAAGVDPGAPVVVLNGEVVPAGLQEAERGLQLNWRVGPSGKDFSDRYFASMSVAGGLRAWLPLSPVHLNWAAMSDGSARLSWIRRTRRNGDSWLGFDVPLGEDSETYRVTIESPEGAVLHEGQTSIPELILSPGLVATLPPSVTATVRQISLTAGDGLPGTKTFSIA